MRTLMKKKINKQRIPFEIKSCKEREREKNSSSPPRIHAPQVANFRSTRLHPFRSLPLYYRAYEQFAHVCDARFSFILAQPNGRNAQVVSLPRLPKKPEYISRFSFCSRASRRKLDRICRSIFLPSPPLHFI